MKADTAYLKELFNHISSETFTIREISNSDIFPLFDATKHDCFNKFLSWEHPKNIDELNFDFKLLLRENQLNESAIFSICEKNNGKWIGNFKLTPYQNSYRISFWVHPDYWKKFYPINILYTIITAFFKFTHYQYFYCRISKDNKPLIKSAYSVNAVLINEKEIEFPNGKKFIDCIFSLDRSIWTNYHYNKIEYRE